MTKLHLFQEVYCYAVQSKEKSRVDLLSDSPTPELLWLLSGRTDPGDIGHDSARARAGCYRKTSLSPIARRHYVTERGRGSGGRGAVVARQHTSTAMSWSIPGHMPVDIVAAIPASRALSLSPLATLASLASSQTST